MHRDSAFVLMIMVITNGDQGQRKDLREAEELLYSLSSLGSVDCSDAPGG